MEFIRSNWLLRLCYRMHDTSRHQRDVHNTATSNPSMSLKIRTAAVILITVFLHGATHASAGYYLPLYFQVVNNMSATMSGIQLLPLALMTAITSIITSCIIAKTGDYRCILWISWTVVNIPLTPFILIILGMGLMIDLKYPSNTIKNVIYLLILDVGVGDLFQSPLIALQAACQIARWPL